MQRWQQEHPSQRQPSPHPVILDFPDLFQPQHKDEDELLELAFNMED
jgi:hypothetical protein